MSVLLAVVCFFYGTENIRAAFSVPVSDFEIINWLLLLTGVGLIAFGIALTLLAVKEQKEKQDKLKNPPPTKIIEDDEIEYETDYFSDEILEEDDTNTQK